VAKKLAASGREETHAFVLVPGLFAEAPFAVIDVLMADVGPVANGLAHAALRHL